MTRGRDRDGHPGRRDYRGLEAAGQPDRALQLSNTLVGTATVTDCNPLIHGAERNQMTSFDRPARHIAFPAIVVLAFAMSAVILWDGDDGVRLPIYVKVMLLPWQDWASVIAAGGLLLAAGMAAEHLGHRSAAHHLAVGGLIVLTGWWALRWSLLAYGAAETGPPHAGAVSYAFITFIHLMALMLEVWPTLDRLLDQHADRRAQKRARRRG